MGSLKYGMTCPSPLGSSVLKSDVPVRSYLGCVTGI